MKNFKLIPFLLLFLITVNCGFKVLDRSALNKFKINEINSSGNKKINFLIRNDLYNLLNSNRSNDLLKINLITNKVKNIKEKNKKNQITKYNIIINSTIEFHFVNKDIKEIVNIEKTGHYLVASNHNDTLSNLKSLEKNLSEQVSRDIANKLVQIINEL